MRRNVTQLAGVSILLAILATINLAYAAEPAAPNIIDILVGTQHSITAAGDKPISKVDVSDSSVVSARIEGSNRVFLTALRKGISTVHVWQEERGNSEYMVSTWNILPEDIQYQIRGIPGISTRRAGARLMVIGNVLTTRDRMRVQRLSENFTEDIIDLVYEDRHQYNQEMIRRILAEIGIPSIDARFVDKSLILSGTVYREEDKSRAEILANAYIGENGRVSNTIIVTDILVQIDIVFAKVTPQTGSEIGADRENLGIIGLPGVELTTKRTDTSPGGQLRVGSLGYGLSGLIDPTLKLLETQGLGKVLDQAYVATKSGKTGFVQRGGTLYVKTSGVQSGDLVPVEYGLLLEVTPVVKPILGHDNKPLIGIDGKEQQMVSFEVTIEVSQPIDARGSGADIQTDKFKTSTFGNVNINETLVIAGLKQISRSRTKSNVPVIGNIPLLNLLFAREDKSEALTDIAAFLTPRVVSIERRPDDKSIVEEAERVRDEAKTELKLAR